ncbi:MAG TPA: 3-hydroxyacyl-CoA dehydrogenase [Acidobacteria bacterium]|nr:3-hydroxyacyl-CoA dehydrogenase [Acidobacteriota bacterium]
MTNKVTLDLSALNIRNFPRELLRRCKIRALEMDVSLRDLVIEALSRYVTSAKDRKGKW